MYSVDVTMNSAYKECIDIDCIRKTCLKRVKKELEDYKLKVADLKKEAYEDLKEYRIMEIFIMSQYNNEAKLLNGTILLNKDRNILRGFR